MKMETTILKMDIMAVQNASTLKMELFVIMYGLI